MNFIPRPDRVVVEQIDAEATSAGGIVPTAPRRSRRRTRLSPWTRDVHSLGVVLQGTNFVPISLIGVPPVTEAPSEFAKLSSLSSEMRGRSLTPRQRQVLQLLVSGQSNKEIAHSLNLGEGTVKVHLSALFRNLGVANRVAAAVVGARAMRGKLGDDGMR